MPLLIVYDSSCSIMVRCHSIYTTHTYMYRQSLRVVLLPRSCPAAISSFCRDVQPGNANVISCLQANMIKSDFPARCKAVLLQMSSRADLKYSLNPKLKAVCDPGEEVLCLLIIDWLDTFEHATPHGLEMLFAQIESLQVSARCVIPTYLPRLSHCGVIPPN